MDRPVPQLPPDFDPHVYLAHNPDLTHLDDAAIRHHFHRYGATEGRACNAIDGRVAFERLVPTDRPLLEIGPFCWPSFRRPRHQVHYLDVRPAEELRAIALELTDEADPQVPPIDYVWTGQPYSELVGSKEDGPAAFSAVFSAHNIEHQPCLVSHLADLHSILEPGGQVFLVIPDACYSFDHFLSLSSIGDVLEAHMTRRRRHSPRNVLEHRLLLTHNDPVRHWQGDHGADPHHRPLGDYWHGLLARTQAELRQHALYIDAHAWRFRPQTFRSIMRTLFDAGLTRLRVQRVYPTRHNQAEFFAVLGEDPA